MTNLTYTDDLVIETCWCGIYHAIPKTLHDHMKRQHQKGKKQVGVFCPLGHSWIFSGKSELEVERERRLAAEATAARRADQLEMERKSHAATKGQLTKTKKRISGGVCPCCNRTFVKLGQHMKIKHPDYAAAASS